MEYTIINTILPMRRLNSENFNDFLKIIQLVTGQSGIESRKPSTPGLVLIYLYIKISKRGEKLTLKSYQTTSHI